jgi:hypothetical protein
LTNLAEENMPGPRLTAYYAERARGAGQQHLFTAASPGSLKHGRPHSSRNV